MGKYQNSGLTTNYKMRRVRITKTFYLTKEMMKLFHRKYLFRNKLEPIIKEKIRTKMSMEGCRFTRKY